MTVSAEPSAPSGILTAPPSKSETHRLLLCAGLADGESTVDNVMLSEDIRATIRCLEAFGCGVRTENGTAVIRGTGDLRRIGERPFDCGESGSTLRFFLPLCLLNGRRTTLCGSPSLFSRPLGVYEKLCAEKGFYYKKDDRSVTVEGRLTGGEFTVPGSVSSQFISGLLFALPLLQEDSVLHILPPYESRPYVKMTETALKNAGIDLSDEGETIYVPGSQQYLPVKATVSGDWSNAAVLYAFRENGADVRITGLTEDSPQGDRCCKEYLKRLKNGCPTLDLADCPDLAPILFAFAAAHNGAVFHDTARLRYKESDRIEAMRDVLESFGAKLNAQENSVEIPPAKLQRPTHPVSGHNDHRIVMAAAFLLTLTGGTLNGAEAVGKSFPGFFTLLQNAGVKLQLKG